MRRFFGKGVVDVKLTVWAKQIGVSYRTAWQWFKDGKLPIESEKLPSGTIIVYPDRPIKRADDNKTA